jgi:hypothetical protein
MFDEGREAVRRSIDRYEPRQVDFFEAWAPSEVRTLISGTIHTKQSLIFSTIIRGTETFTADQVL